MEEDLFDNLVVFLIFNCRDFRHRSPVAVGILLNIRSVSHGAFDELCKWSSSIRTDIICTAEIGRFLGSSAAIIRLLKGCFKKNNLMKVQKGKKVKCNLVAYHDHSTL